ncbi:MAG: hypothetical protein V4677_05505 [Bacteroidota bacterium]
MGWLIECLNFLKIVASPFLAGLLIAFMFYLYKPDTTGLLIAAGITVFSLILGVLLARYVSRSTTATAFNARIYASPDLDNLNKEGSDQKVVEK